MELLEWAYKTAEIYLANPLPRRWRHVRAVAEKARLARPSVGPDADLLEAAAILHDIGYAPDLAETGFHPLDGARFLESAAAPARLVALVAHHSAAAWDAEVVGMTEQLRPYRDESTVTRDALWWADMTTGPDGQSMTFEERMNEVVDRYGPDHAVSQAISRSWDARQQAVSRTEALIR